MYFSTSTYSQIGASFTPSLAEPVDSDSKTNLKAFIIQSSPMICPCSSHIFGCNLYLKHHLGDENSLPNKIIKMQDVLLHVDYQWIPDDCQFYWI